MGGTFSNSSFETGVLMAYSAAARMAKMMDLFIAFIFLNFKVENTMILALLKYHSANLFKRTGLLQNSAKRWCSEAKPAFDKSKVNTGEIRPLPEWMP